MGARAIDPINWVGRRVRCSSSFLIRYITSADAAALTGEVPAALTCRGLAFNAPTDGLVSIAADELGTIVLSGAHSEARGWSIGSWLVAHGSRLGIDRVTFEGTPGR